MAPPPEPVRGPRTLPSEDRGAADSNIAPGKPPIFVCDLASVCKAVQPAEAPRDLPH